MANKIVFYQSPEEMTIKRFQRFQKFLMIDNEVGSTFEDFDQRTHKSVEFLRKKMYDEAIKELENRRQSAWNSYTNYSPKNNALALLVKSINGKDYTDKFYMTDEGMEEIIDKLDQIGYCKRQADEDLDSVKKKSLEFWSCITRNFSKATIKLTSIFCTKKS